MKCYYCKKLGHGVSDCWKKKADMDSRSNEGESSTSHDKNKVMGSNSTGGYRWASRSGFSSSCYNGSNQRRAALSALNIDYNDNSSEKWILDSCASYHMTYREDFFQDYEAYEETE